MNRVPFLGLRIELPDRTGIGLGRVGGADDGAEMGDRVRSLQDHGQAGTGSHEGAEGVVEGTPAMDLVERLRLGPGELGHPGGADGESSAFEMGENFPGLGAGDGVGFDDRESLHVAVLYPPSTLRTMSPRVMNPTSTPSLTTGNRSTSLFTIMFATSARVCSSETQRMLRSITFRTESVCGSLV